MNRVSIKEQAFNFVVFLLLQLPLVYRITLFDKAFAFFYVGFLLLLPPALSRIKLMLLGFFSGLLVDVFCNTPGIHASASVFILFIRKYWLGAINDDFQELTSLNLLTLKKVGFIFYILPLIFVHHITIFLVENGGFHMLGRVLNRALLSTVFSGGIVFLINFISTPNSRRS